MSPADLATLLDLLGAGPAVVLSGAGCSTGSGIPDYRGPDGSLRARTPMMWQDFVRTPEARVRYWSRSAAGWPRIRDARPNPAHTALATLERAGAVRGVITQNVDGLHQAAGSRSVLELHGALARVRCLACDEIEDRNAFQGRLLELNPGIRGASGPLAPDGDAEVAFPLSEHFRVPACLSCEGTMKPDVVFFGENVPRERLDRAWGLFDEAALLLVVGSSLTVFSGRRFVLRARERGKPVVLINLGTTRCDADAALKVEAPVEDVLPLLAGSFPTPPMTPPPPIPAARHLHPPMQTKL
jgi:NAD+-dependent protein deacetylase sirtuin 4